MKVEVFLGEREKDRLHSDIVKWSTPGSLFIWYVTYQRQQQKCNLETNSA